MARHDLTESEWALVEPVLPTNNGKVGAPYKQHRPIIDGIFWRLATGTPWRDIPKHYGAWQTLVDRYRNWLADGTWTRILEALQLKLDANGQIDFEQWGLDATIVRAHRAAGGARKKGAQDAAAQNQQTTHLDAQLAASQPRSTC